MPQPQENDNLYSHLPNSQDSGAGYQQDSGEFGPTTFQAAATQARLYPHEVDTLSGLRPAISSTARPQIQGPSNHQTDPYRHGHSLQYPPHMYHHMTHDQDPLFPGNGCGGSTSTHIGAYQYPASNYHSQPFHSPQSQPQPQPQHIPQALQPAPLPGGSQRPHPIIENVSAWQLLCSDRTQWNSNAPEPLRRDGESILMDFTLRGEIKIHCRVPTRGGLCDYANFKKERLLHHIRKDHLNFLPYVCGGACPSQTCQLRFASEKARNEHINPRKNECPFCKKKLFSQNYSTHYAKCQQRQRQWT